MKRSEIISRLLTAALFAGLALAALSQPCAAQEDSGEVDKERMFDKPDQEDAAPEDGAIGGTSYDPADQKEPEAVNLSDAPTALPTHGYTIQFIHKDGLAPGKAALRATFPLSLSGCFEIIPPEVESKIMGQQLRIVYTDPIIKKDKTPQYAHNACKTNSGGVSVDVVLDRDEMIKAKINKITLRNNFGQDSYDVLVTENKISLFKKYRDPLTNKEKRIDWHDDKRVFMPYKGRQTETPLTFWFYPENTVVLTAPMARQGQDVSAEISRFAQTRGMMPLQAFFDDFKSPSNDPNRLYYVDQVGTLSQTLAAESGRPVGEITVGDSFHGPDGPYERPRKIAVFASAPGLMD